ncbi:MAG TPA: cobalamin-binding protein [Candidatus Angelobacter sp.]|nr:cobalamin-binding protein [Candidatus Angelobacter sp.]
MTWIKDVNTMAVAQRIVSFLPSATEMVCALGLEDHLVGITHECDYPPSVKSKPVVVSSAVPVENMTEAEIDKAVSERVQAGLSVYQVDEALLRQLAPDLILAQNLCDVCAPSGNEVSRALQVLVETPEVVHLSPKSLKGILEKLREVGQAAGCVEAAERWIKAASEKLERIAATARALPTRPRVFCMEWLDPLYCSGHWVPEMVRIAGGVDELSREGSDSIRIPWKDVQAWSPEVLIVMPCGCHLEKVVELAAKLGNLPGWGDIPAVRNRQVFAADASSYFARPGPRVLEGTELLAHLIHPEAFDWQGPRSAYQRIEIAPAA